MEGMFVLELVNPFTNLAFSGLLNTLSCIVTPFIQLSIPMDHIILFVGLFLIDIRYNSNKPK